LHGSHPHRKAPGEEGRRRKVIGLKNSFQVNSMALDGERKFKVSMGGVEEESAVERGEW